MVQRGAHAYLGERTLGTSHGKGKRQITPGGRRPLCQNKTEAVLSTLKSSGTTPALISPGCTSLLQPLDVVFKHTFKQRCADLFAKHISRKYKQKTMCGNYKSPLRLKFFTLIVFACILPKLKLFINLFHKRSSMTTPKIGLLRPGDESSSQYGLVKSGRTCL